MKINIILTVVYDNNPNIRGLETDWGFSCFIESGKTKILFDTGDNGKILLSNMEKLNIDPRIIDIVFLSHYHHDHTGGLKDFLEVNSRVKVYYPQSLPQEIKDVIKNAGAWQVPVSEFMEITPNVFTLGEIQGSIPEQSLAIRSANGIIVITGCAHPGIINILEKAKNKFPGELIYLALGGFHLHRLSDEEINNTIKKIFELDVLTVAPTHCSGNTVRRILKEEFGKYFVEVGVGKILEIF